MTREPESTYAESIDSIEHYTGGAKCQYACGDLASFVVVARLGGVTTETFVGCRECLNDARIYPITNGWVDERTDKVDSA